ncbi:MAG: hypothetical protein QM811_01065 [Pirellulales bacterium]
MKSLFAELAKRSGNPIDNVDRLPAELLKHTLDVEWKETPFWKALDEVLDQTQLSIYPFATGGGLSVVPKNNRQLPRSERAGYTGPLRLEANRVSLERDPRLAESPRMRVGLEISWESRLNPISVEIPLAKVKAIDDQRKTLDSLRSDGTATSLISDRAKGTEVEVLLEGPGRGADLARFPLGRSPYAAAGARREIRIRRSQGNQQARPTLGEENRPSDRLDRTDRQEQ